MSKEEFERLRGDVVSSEELRTGLSSATSEDEWLAIVQDNGYEIEFADLPGSGDRELADGELEGVAGGSAPVVHTSLLLCPIN